MQTVCELVIYILENNFWQIYLIVRPYGLLTILFKAHVSRDKKKTWHIGTVSWYN